LNHILVDDLTFTGSNIQRQNKYREPQNNTLVDLAVLETAASKAL